MYRDLVEKGKLAGLDHTTSFPVRTRGPAPSASLAALILPALLSLSAVAFQPGLPAEDRILPLVPGEQPPGALSGWELEGIRVSPGFASRVEMSLSGTAYRPDPDTDFILHFDGTAPFQVAEGDVAFEPGPGFVRGAGKIGPGSGRFTGSAAGSKLLPGPRSALSAGREFRDFCVEFWLNPSSTGDGARVFSWEAGRIVKKRDQRQRLECRFRNGRLEWTLSNVFTRADGADTLVTLAGRSLIVPGEWSHHSLRFDSSSGMVEYLVGATPEAIAYATETGREGPVPALPYLGSGGSCVVGSRYSGLLDEFRLSLAWVERPVTRSFPLEGASATSPVIDTGSSATRLLGVKGDVKGGPETAVEFLARAGESWADWNDASPEWIPVRRDAAADRRLRGRYQQIRVGLYPGNAGDESPRVSNLSLVLEEDPPPPPPARLVAIAGDGRVMLSWTAVRDADLAGYRLYFGLASGVYDGEGEGSGPITLPASATAFTVEGLKNGTLYYFAVAAFDSAAIPHEGEFSREANARPLRSNR